MRLFAPLSLAMAASAATFPFEETTIDQLHAGLKANEITVQGIVEHYLERIDALNHKGPHLNGVIETATTALDVAKQQDKATSSPKGILHGIPILLKANIATKGDGLTACAGSLAMEGNIAPEDAFVVKKLREAGAIILGHANMVEWANWRSISGGIPWSARGGITKNPYVLTAPTSGSSSGSAVSVAANMIPVSIGTETGMHPSKISGSITSPSNRHSVVGLKPTVGLVSRSGIVPLSLRQDSPGPVGRTVRDVALVLEVIAGHDPKDAQSKDVVVPKYSQSLQTNSNPFKNLRIAISKEANSVTNGMLQAHVDALAKAIQWFEANGATIVYAPLPNAKKIADSKCEYALLQSDFREDIDSYLSTLTWKTGVPPMKSLKDITDYNTAHPDTELKVLDQSLMLASLAAPSRNNQSYIDLLKQCNDLAVTNGIDKYFKDTHADVIVAVTDAWGNGPESPGYPGIAGYPILTVPLSYVYSIPFGLSFVGQAFTEEKLLQYGYAFEQANKARIPPTYLSGK
ncbi:Aste57867_20842 [Aphanomyces stellatus]|uniref:Aste57867_20842 protein n=1 Tax=Aphanomyces stellatus TaxID=120398 RepID=A0A485LG37_9STRA|nr:hypothetical protein As57867_020774 [Aphanomyces stellatus]VFT97520.1 Aste57867_20842 [Aphanomyces stellatus]